MTWAQDAQRQLAKRNNALPPSARRSHYEKVIDAMIQETSESRRLKPIFDSIDVDGNGTLDRNEFTEAYKKYNPDLSDKDIVTLFESIDSNGSGLIGKLQLETELCSTPTMKELTLFPRFC
jgi:Ca2+-binding EF-hand superfamily protein